MVTTVFVANAFLDYFDKTGEEEHLTIAMARCDFILEHLILFEEEDTLCFGYIPGEKARVHNASVLGAALLGRVFAYKKEEEFLEKSRKAMAYAIKALRRDYSWPYGERHHHQFVDNFHTGFNLVALHVSTVSAAEVTSNYDDVTLIPENSFTDKYLIHFHGD